LHIGAALVVGLGTEREEQLEAAFV
jgi:hypothetical protein